MKAPTEAMIREGRRLGIKKPEEMLFNQLHSAIEKLRELEKLRVALERLGVELPKGTGLNSARQLLLQTRANLLKDFVGGTILMSGCQYRLREVRISRREVRGVMEPLAGGRCLNAGFPELWRALNSR